MSKYLFYIILGIVLFLYINSIEGLNVGEDCERVGDGNCNDGIGICQDDICECVDVRGNNICQLKIPDPDADGEAGQIVRDRKREIEEIERMTDLQKLNFVNQCASLHYNIEPNEPKTLNVQMRSNKTDNTTHPSYCEFRHDMVGDIEKISIKSQCNLCLNASCNQIGKQYDLPKLNCSFNFEYSETSLPNSYVSYGYEKLPRFLDLENDPIFQEFVNVVNTGVVRHIVEHPSINLYYNTTIADVKLTFATYMLLRYIERISDGQIKTIIPGIFYCNGRIYYYVSFETQFRVVKPRGTYYYLNDPYLVKMMNKYYELANSDTTNASLGSIHTDFNITGIPRKYFPEGTCLDSDENLVNVGTQELCEQGEHTWNHTPPYDTYNTSVTTLLNVDSNLERPNADIGCQVETSLSELERLLLSHNRLNLHNIISFKEAFVHETDLKTGELGELEIEDFANASLMLYHLINHNKADDKYDLFNIWLQLIGSYDDKTMGFFNSPQTNEGLEDLYKVNDDNTFSAVIGFNLANIEHLSDKTARTYVMNDGDALRFTDDKTPHFGRSSEYGIRFSKEGRYLLYDIDFDLNSVFEISPDGTTLLVKTNAGNVPNVPNVIPPYLPLTIYKYFQDEFSLISQQYNRIQGRLSPRILELEYNEMITMEIFQAILDNVPFQDYKWMPDVIPQIDQRASHIIRWNNPGIEAFLTI